VVASALRKANGKMFLSMIDLIGIVVSIVLQDLSDPSDPSNLVYPVADNDLQFQGANCLQKICNAVQKLV
jgi:hypothetical protein